MKSRVPWQALWAHIGIGADGFIDMQAHVLNAFATAVSNDNIR
jgi:hypothetical protein